MVATLQYFALNTLHAGFAAAAAALPTAAAAHLGYTPGLLQRPTVADPNIVVVGVVVDETDLVGDLADLHEGVYPTDLCQHRWWSLDSLRRSGFHVLGQSERSHEEVAGRVFKFVRPQQSTDPAALNYGTGDGSLHRNAYNGPQDPAIGVGDHTAQTHTSYGIHFGAHVRWGNMGSGGNPLFGNGFGDQGSIAIEDATGLGPEGEIVIYYDDERKPGMFWGSYTLWERHGGDHPWVEYSPGVYVHPYFQNGGGGQGIGNLSTCYDGDVDDITVNAETLLQRHLLCGVIGGPAALAGVGGRGRYQAQVSFGGANEAWLAVLLNDGAGNWTDVTAAANSAGANDFDLIPAGAANGAYVAFISATQPSVLRLNLAQVLVGGTVVPGYSLGGGDVTGVFDYVSDPTVGLTSGTAFQEVVFAPKADWASDTFAAGETFEATGFAVVFRKTAGTVTQAARGDQAFMQRRGVYIHRWDDGAPTRGLCTGNLTISGAAAGTSQGLRYRTEGKGNIRFVNGRQAVGRALHDTWTNAQLTFESMQIISFASHQFASGNNADLTFRVSTSGAPYWSITDHLVQSGEDVIFTDPECGLVAYHGDDPAYYAQRARWSDLCYVLDGLYKNNGQPKFTCQGFVTRKANVQIMGMNDLALDLFEGGSNDHHFLAGRNNQDWTDDIMESIGFEEVIGCEFYAAGTGGNDAPVIGSGSNQRNIKLKHGYVHTWNGREDSGQPARGFGFVGDPDRGKYVNGTGQFDGNEVEFFYFKEMWYSANTSVGQAITASQETLTRVRNVTAERCNWLYTIGREHQQAMFVFQFDASTGVYTDITTAMLPTGGIGQVADMFPASPAAGDMCVFAMPVSMEQPPRRCGLTFNTPASMGTASVSWVVWGGAGWEAVAGLLNGQLTSDNITQFHRPSSFGELDINGTLYHAFAVRLDSGVFATMPVLEQVTGRLCGGGIDLADYVVKNPRQGVGYVSGSNASTNGSIVKDHRGKVIFGPGQDENTPLWGWFSSTPTLTAAQWQALEKLTLNTHALEDSEFGVDLVLTT